MDLFCGDHADPAVSRAWAFTIPKLGCRQRQRQRLPQRTRAVPGVLRRPWLRRTLAQRGPAVEQRNGYGPYTRVGADNHWHSIFEPYRAIPKSAMVKLDNTLKVQHGFLRGDFPRSLMKPNTARTVSLLWLNTNGLTLIASPY